MNRGCAEPVLILGFNRPTLLEGLIERLRQVRPERVYVSIDGPRVGRVEDDEDVGRCRELVSTIDWTGQVLVRSLDRNLGCGVAVASAIKWFFTFEDRGIILEDDVLPSPSFFPYCSTLLDRYENDERVLAINGHNLVPPRVLSRPELPYRFVTYTEMWGWALWKRSWDNYTFDISGWRARLTPRRLWEWCGRSVPGALFWASMFDVVATGRLDIWDVQLAYSAVLKDQLLAVPNVNLTDNVGFGPGATHYFHPFPTMQPSGAMHFPISDVPIERDTMADVWLRRHHFQVEMRVQQTLQRKSPGFQEYVRQIIELQRQHHLYSPN